MRLLGDQPDWRSAVAARTSNLLGQLPPIAGDPFISVVVPTYRRFEPVLATVRDLLSQRYGQFEVIVADQNSEWPAEYRDERDRLRTHPTVRWLELNPPAVVPARNEAVRQSRGDILVFVDDDVRITDPDFLTRHVSNYATPGITAVAGREMKPTDPPSELPPPAEAASEIRSDRPPLETIIGFDRNTSRRVEACVFSTCNCSVRRDAFLTVYGFDENYSGNSYGDDSDFALRLHAVGGRIIYDPTAALIHLSAPMGGLRLSDRSNLTTHTDRVLSGWLFHLRHARPGYRWTILRTQVLRRTILLRANVVRPWRQFGAWAGLLFGYLEARRRLERGVRSRFVALPKSEGPGAAGRCPE